MRDKATTPAPGAKRKFAWKFVIVAWFVWLSHQTRANPPAGTTAFEGNSHRVKWV